MKHHAWTGLTNPLADVEITCVREDWERLKAKRWRVWVAWDALYRTYMRLRKSLGWLANEVTTSKKRTVAEVVFGLPVIALTFQPYREAVTRHPYGWPFIGGCIFVNFVLTMVGRAASARRSQLAVQDFAERQYIITRAAQRHAVDYTEGKVATPASLQSTIETVLTAIAEMGSHLLQVPSDVSVHANLMIRMPVRLKGAEGLVGGCGIVCYSANRPSEPTWTRLVSDDFGAARVFSTGKVQVIEDTRHPQWCGVFNNIQTRSFVALPVITRSQKVVAVVTLAADKPYVFTRKNSHKTLHRVLAGPLSLLENILYVTRNGALEPPSAQLTGD